MLVIQILVKMVVLVKEGLPVLLVHVQQDGQGTIVNKVQWNFHRPTPNVRRPKPNCPRLLRN